MRHLIYQIALSLTIIVSCESEKNIAIKNPDLTVDPVYLEPDYFGVCFGGLINADADSIIIKTNAQYQQLGDSCRRLWMSSVKCDTAQLPVIDFTKYSLIGKYTQGGGCSDTKEYDLEIDTLNKKYIYSIQRQYVGSCTMLIIDMNWALVPAISDNYEVEFRLLRE